MNENLNHFILHCKLYDNIRQQFVPKFLLSNTKISEIMNNENNLIISMLDPLSSKLPKELTDNWSSVSDAYELGRQFCYRMHMKREKIYKALDNS